MAGKLHMFLTKNKKGYVLMELVCSAAIISILCSTVILSIKSYKDIRNALEVKYVNNQMVNFINTSRNYCIAKGTCGKLFLNMNLNRVEFFKDINSNIDIFVLPQGFKLEPVATNNGLILIDENGMLLNACSIAYKDSKKGTHIITVCVGTGNVEIKK
ncbi:MULTISPECIES: pilus assembly FimT family protein [Clostridium]|uniref:pilus assembly FimT family protein n=1 Tax=Clostridium TaxID=1485 RepID=UPI000825A3AF|nr:MULTISPECIES: type II secretion system protein [Clostridium]PJI09920.1 type II secretion system protein [Clostridium sp. CT7]